MTPILQDSFFWALIAVIVTTVVAGLRARGTNMDLRRQNTGLDDERTRLQHRLDELGTAHSFLTTRQAAELVAVRQDAEEDTKSVLKAAMRTLQALADEQQVVIEELQRRYGDNPRFLADLMLVDHTNSQFGRRAQGIAVLCGGWLGRRETVASVYDVARSAQGRIRHFDRVEIYAQVNVNVASRAVEPVAVVLAELLANATNYSAPDTKAHISVQSVPTGVCVIVDDAGLGMGQEEKDLAAELLNPDAPVNLTGLGNPPRFGFAVAGLLAARYGFKVSVDSVSPYGGVRAVVLLPAELLTSEAPPQAPDRMHRVPGQASSPAPAQAPEPADELAPSEPAQVRLHGTTDGGLPKRRRQSPVSVLPRPQADLADEPVPAPASEETAARLGAFQRGTRSGRTTMTTEGTEIQ
ncbi:ATP-binding protein [Streptacidiphilus sp. MAP12-33]|uniref:ATP-binding protein n=1 Tax=Streptacidiphilus sp. MAP12-33 TaxID=3156266 RepID=UPI0035113FFA